MSTDLRDPSSKPPADRPEPEEKPKPALSITQVVGGALAAMTAAFLGSRLSVAGTVVGAALASVVAAVAGAVYTSSLRRTTQTVSTVWKTRVRPDGHGGTETVVEEVTEDGTTVLPAVPSGETPADPTSPSTRAPQGGTRSDGPADGRPRRRLGWKSVVVAAVLMFAIAAVALTGLELATGRALSGGTGTTVGQVAEGRDAPSTKPSPTPRRTPRATPSATASAEPSTSASSTPSSAPSTGPSPTLSAEPSTTPSPTPSSSVTSSASPGAGATP